MKSAFLLFRNLNYSNASGFKYAHSLDSQIYCLFQKLISVNSRISCTWEVMILLQHISA